MPTFEIWGQEDKSNLAHSSNYEIVEALNVEADDPKSAVEKFFMQTVEEAMTTGKPFTELLPPPANGDHWHFRVTALVDLANGAEFAVRLHMLPALEVAELKPEIPAEGEAD